MIIKLSNDLKKEEMWANGTELASIMGKDRKNGRRVLTYPLTEKQFVYSFNNPVLLTDNYRIAKLKPRLRDSIFSLLANRPRIVTYDNVSVFWDHSHINVWCPSIDTLLFANALRRLVKRNSNFRTAAEIGCGSGFLSKYILTKNKNIKSMLVNDLNPYAIKCAMDNIKDHRAVFYTGDGLKKIHGHKFDLLICNPPYVPRPNSIDDNPYEGVGLLNHLLHEGQKYLNKGGVIITNISSLCENIVLKNKTKMKLNVLEEMRVPLKVNNIVNNKKWINHLKKLGLVNKYKEGYDYWHTIKIIMLENK